jgi:gamma-glutamyltranspeptidase/glutathione hydrolase
LLLLQVLKPAIQLADTGFAVSPITAYHWGKSAYAIRKQGCTEAAAGALLQANGQAPVAGQRWCNKHMAATLQRVAQLGAKEGEQRLPW